MTLPPASDVALVSGAARGIGRAIAQRLAADGWRLALVDVDAAALAATVDALNAAAPTHAHAQHAGFVTDVADEAQVAALARRVAEGFGGLRALVNNAGIGGVGTRIDDLTLADWNAMIGTDLTSVFLMCRAFAPPLRASGRGRIVNLGSISASMGVSGSSAYTAAKGGVTALSKSLAREFATDRVTVNVVAPGVIDTDMSRRRGIDHQRHLIPGDRIGRPDDVAGAVAYLLGDDAEFVTGHVLHVNGGAYM